MVIKESLLSEHLIKKTTKILPDKSNAYTNHDKIQEFLYWYLMEIFWVQNSVYQHNVMTAFIRLQWIQSGSVRRERATTGKGKQQCGQKWMKRLQEKLADN